MTRGRRQVRIRKREGRGVFVSFVMLVLTGIVLLSGGCAMPILKDTPLYSGNYESTPEATDDRIPAWPILYHRAPVLQVLWPFVEKTPDYFTVRPITSVHGLGTDKKIYNAVWPVARFDTYNKDYRIFPAFWGEDYFTLFPLYWHLGHPFGPEGGMDCLVPLWCLQRDRHGYNTHLLWPFVNFKNYDGCEGWRLWPLMGGYADKNKAYRFLGWPLGHQWSRESDRTFGHTLLPLYWYERDESASLWASLLYSRYAKSNGDGWQCLFPAYYASRDGDRRMVATLLGGYRKDRGSLGWIAVPLLSGGTQGDGRGNVWVLGPLAHADWDKESKHNHLFPLYYYGKDKTGSLFATLLYANGSDAKDKTGWHAVLPLYYTRKGPNHRAVATLLGGYRRNGDNSAWMALPLLSGGRRGKNSGSAWILGPTAHIGWDESGSNHHVFPFYYRSKDKDGALTVSLPWIAGSNAGGDSWQTVPGLYWRSKGEKSERMITPLYAQGHSERHNRKWHSVVPLYYRRTSDRGTLLATLLGGRQKDADGGKWLIYPLLSWGRRGKHDGSAWFLAPIVRYAWDKDSKSHHVLPIYYWDGRDDTFASLLAASWKGRDNRRTTLVPPALSWYTGGRKRKDLWLLGPTAHFSWGEQGGPQHVLPLAYYNKRSGTFVSPLVAKWKNEDGRKTAMFPPALSWMSQGKLRSDLWMFGPLVHFSWGEKGGSQHVFPLYYGNTKSGTFVSPLAARWNRSDGRKTTMVPAALSWVTTGKKRSDLWLAGPLARFSWGEQGGPQHIFPLAYVNSKSGTFVSLPVSRWRDDDDSVNWLIPPILGGYTHHRNAREFAALLGLVYNRWGSKTQSPRGHFFPLYYYEGTDKVYTPLVGWNNDKRDGFFYPLTPLLGVRTGQYEGGWLFPLYSYERHKGSNRSRMSFLWGGYERHGRHSRSGMFPFWGYKNHGQPEKRDPKVRYATYGKDFWSLPACWYRNQVEIRPDRRKKTTGTERPVTERFVRKHGFFPLWGYSRREVPTYGETDVDSWLLAWLYTYHKAIEPSVKDPDKTDERTISRILWKLYYHERKNDRVTMDIFPAITYDRRGEDYKRITFLTKWFFRYERDKDGTKVNLLCIPVLW